MSTLLLGLLKKKKIAVIPNSRSLSILIKKLLKLLMCYKNVCFSKITFGRLNSVVDKNHKCLCIYMVIEIAKGFIILNTHMKLTSPWSEDSHKICLFCTIWQCQQLQKIYQPTNQPTNHCFIRNCTKSNVKNITLFF